MDISNFEKCFSEKEHCIITQRNAKNVTTDQWKAEGEPCMWTLSDKLMHEGHLYLAWHDHGHGFWVLERNGLVECYTRGKAPYLQCNNVVLLCEHSTVSNLLFAR